MLNKTKLSTITRCTSLNAKLMEELLKLKFNVVYEKIFASLLKFGDEW